MNEWIVYASKKMDICVYHKKICILIRIKVLCFAVGQPSKYIILLGSQPVAFGLVSTLY